jgi:hypothetical protein
MSILNRRNAIFGYAVWETGKRVMKMRAKRAAGLGAGPKVWALRLGAGLAAAAGGVWALKRLVSRGDAADD